jgi:branched-chain amino acid transport system permease protein
LILLVQQVLFPAPLGVVINGIVLGLITALVALGMFLVYRANRVLNFAQGELGLIPTILAVMLVVESGFPWLAGLGIGLAASFTLGGASEFLVIRRFFRAPRLVLTVATLGLSQALAVPALLMPRRWDSKVVSQRIAVPIDAVWDGRAISDGALNSRINAVRRAVGDDGTAQAVIRITLPVARSR